MLLEFLKEAAKLALIAVMFSDFQSAKRYHGRTLGLSAMRRLEALRYKSRRGGRNLRYDFVQGIGGSAGLHLN